MSSDWSHGEPYGGLAGRHRRGRTSLGGGIWEQSDGKATSAAGFSSSSMATPTRARWSRCSSSPAKTPIRFATSARAIRRGQPSLGLVMIKGMERERAHLPERHHPRSARRLRLPRQDGSDPGRQEAQAARLSRHFAVRQDPGVEAASRRFPAAERAAGELGASTWRRRAKSSPPGPVRTERNSSPAAAIGCGSGTCRIRHAEFGCARPCTSCGSAPAPRAGRTWRSRDSADRTRAGNPWPCSAPPPRSRPALACAGGSRSRARPPGDRSRPPPSARSAPRRSARRCSARGS